MMVLQLVWVHLMVPETKGVSLEEIEHRLPAATSRVWHGHPVWFDGDHPIVGYDVRKRQATLDYGRRG